MKDIMYFALAKVILSYSFMGTTQFSKTVLLVWALSLDFPLANARKFCTSERFGYPTKCVADITICVRDTGGHCVLGCQFFIPPSLCISC